MTLAADVVIPLAYVEFTGTSKAGPGALIKPSLILAQMFVGLGNASATDKVPVLVSSPEQASGLFGPGSSGHLMCKAFLANHPTGELYVIPQGDDGGASPRLQPMTIDAPGGAAAPGVIALRIAGQEVPVAVASGDADTVIAAAVAVAANAIASLPVTATAAAEVVTFSAKHGGTIGNDITFSLNDRDEAFPPGVVAFFGASTPGASDPTPAGWIDAMGDTPYDVVVCQYSSPTLLAAVKAEMTRRWGPTVQVQGTAYACHAADPGAGVTFVGQRNDKHLSCRILDPNKGWLSMPCEYAASYAGIAALELAADPGRPLQTLPEAGVYAGRNEPFTARNTLAKSGAVTTTSLAGVSYIEAETLTYRTSPLGADDVSWGYVQVPALLQRIGRRLKGRIEGRYPRHKLARSGNTYPSCVPVVTPETLKGECVAEVEDLENDGYLQDVALWKNDIICEIDAVNPLRVNIGIPARLIQQLRVVSFNIGFGG